MKRAGARKGRTPRRPDPYVGAVGGSFRRGDHAVYFASAPGEDGVTPYNLAGLGASPERTVEVLTSALQKGRTIPDVGVEEERIVRDAPARPERRW